MSAVEVTWTAFQNTIRIAQGDSENVAEAVHRALAFKPAASILIFDDMTGRVVDLDLRGSLQEIVARLAPPASPPSAPRGPGRPKLGVVPREVTLLPRHWDWLSAQPGGASVTLRRLVDAARKSEATGRKQAQERTYRVMTALAGNEPGYEEATRALFAGDAVGFQRMTQSWPDDIATYLRVLSGPAFDLPPAP